MSKAAIIPTNVLQRHSLALCPQETMMTQLLNIVVPFAHKKPSSSYSKKEEDNV